MNDADRRVVMAAGLATAFRTGHVFFDVGQTVDSIHFIVSGACSVTVPMGDGSAVEVALCGRERAIGLPSANGTIISFAQIRAETDGTAITVPTDEFRQLIQGRPELRALVTAESMKLMREMAQAAACNAVHKLEPRFAKSLLRFHDRAQGDELALTQERLSRMLGVSRTTLNAVAQALQRQGILRYTRGRLGILDRGKLESIACECYSPSAAAREGSAPQSRD